MSELAEKASCGIIKSSRGDLSLQSTVHYKFNCLPMASNYAVAKTVKDELFNEGLQEVA